MSELKDWVKKMQKGERLALARLISVIESRSDKVPALMKEIFSSTGKARTFGVTGPPGAGKSTLVDGMIKQWRAQNKKVGVIAVDPSSPFSGGAVLGDRIRMQQHFEDEGVYIRSLGTRGRHGGLSHATQEVIHLMDAAGFDRIIVETAGVGQTELDILKAAETVMVVLVPESGDSIQIMKAGLTEIADLFVVNKSDRPESNKMVQELINMIGLTEVSEGDWEVPVLTTQASKNLGLEEVVSALEKHGDHLEASGQREFRRQAFFQAEIVNILSEKLDQDLNRAFDTEQGAGLVTDLAARKTSPYEAASKLFPNKSK